MACMRAWMSLKFGQIRPLISMATDRVIMAKTVSLLFSAVFHPILFILADNTDMHENSKFVQIRPPTAELAALECLKKSP